MRLPTSGLILVAIPTLTLAACTPSPRQRPLQTSPIAEGTQTVEAARKMLEGRWSLLSLDVATQDGRKASVAASGMLTSDAFGNLSIEYTISPEGLKALAGLGIKSPNAVISTSGRVVINPQQQLITYVPPDAAQRAFDADLAARRANPFALEHPRYYSVSADGILTLSTRYEDGKDASIGRWKKG
jgi:hypothetical protein